MHLKSKDAKSTNLSKKSKIIKNNEAQENVTLLLKLIQNYCNKSLNLNFLHYSYFKEMQTIYNYINPLIDEEFNENLETEVEFDKLIPNYANLINIKYLNETEKLEYLKTIVQNSENKIDELETSERFHLEKLQILENSINNEELNKEQKLKIKSQIRIKTNLIIRIQENIKKYKKFTIINYFNPCFNIFYNKIEDEKLILKIEAKLKIPIEKLLIIYKHEIRFVSKTLKISIFKELKRKYLKKLKNITNLKFENEKLKSSHEELKKLLENSNFNKNKIETEIKKIEEKLNEAQNLLKITNLKIKSCEKPWLLHNEPYYCDVNSINSSFRGISKLKLIIFLISCSESNCYEKSITKKLNDIKIINKFKAEMDKVDSYKKLEIYKKNCQKYEQELRNEYKDCIPWHTLIVIFSYFIQKLYFHKRWVL